MKKIFTTKKDIKSVYKFRADEYRMNGYKGNSIGIIVELTNGTFLMTPDVQMYADVKVYGDNPLKMDGMTSSDSDRYISIKEMPEYEFKTIQ